MKGNLVSKIIVFSFVIIIFGFGNVGDARGEGGVIRGYTTSYGERKAPDTLVFIVSMEGEFKAPEEHAVMNQHNTEFEPTMLPVLRGTTVDFANIDTGWHNVNSPDQSVTPFNLGTYPGGVTRSMRFDNIGVAPIACIMHPEMRAHIVVLGNPYYSVSDYKGRYEIKNVPAGKYSLRVWHSRWNSDIVEVAVEAGKAVDVDFALR